MILGIQGLVASMYLQKIWVFIRLNYSVLLLANEICPETAKRVLQVPNNIIYKIAAADS